MIEDQPPPKPTERTPAWELVIKDIETLRRPPSERGAITVLGDGYDDIVLADMRERDRLGRERYGVALQAGNGRNHLVDAYQELLDYIVYLRAWLDEHGVDPHGKWTPGTPQLQRFVQVGYYDAIHRAFAMRNVIDIEQKG